MSQRAHISTIVLAFLFLAIPFFGIQAPSYGAEIDVKDVELVDMWVTAYSSSVDETDSTPNTTAIGSPTRDGVVATNMLPIGTLVRIPEHFGNKVFAVEDRMAPRKRWVLDVWMPSKEDATHFGSYLTKVEILKRG